MFAGLPKKKRIFFTIVLLLSGCVALAGVLLALYPTFSNWWNERHNSRAAADYDLAVSEILDLDALWAQADAYNMDIRMDPNRFHPEAEDTSFYESILDVQGDGTIGYLEIPSLEIRMPFYHGTSEGVLQKAAGHLEGSSFPTGNMGTHSVLSGHTGISRAKLFTDLPKLKEGDTFYVKVLDRELWFRVDQILMVLPTETDALAIPNENAYVTLVTCVPYGVNSHRLLVRGVLIDGPEGDPVY